MSKRVVTHFKFLRTFVMRKLKRLRLGECLGSHFLVIYGLPILLCPIALSLTACTGSKEKPPSILIIAVDGLSSQIVPCRDEELAGGTGGFSLLCHESIQFQNAFTPSTMAEASLASILTGLYPFQHGLRDNSAHSFISAKNDTVAQDAVRLGFRTAFFSGGPPVWRGSGLNHGFELFEDNLNLSSTSIYRPFHQSADLFLNWVQHEAHQDPFLSVIYAPDLRFPSVQTRDVEGNSREQDVGGQLEELEETFDTLVTKLQSLNRWDSTLVIVVGLNGLNSETEKYTEPVGIDLLESNIKVSLFVKPPQKPRDLPLSWSVDQNVSLVDVGRTLKEELGERTHPLPLFPTMSLLKEFHNKTENREQERPILIESGWSAWRGYGSARYAIRKNYFHYIADATPKVFNALTDPRFVNPLSNESALVAGLKQEFEPLLRQLGDAPRFQSVPLLDRQKFELVRVLWGAPNLKKLGASRLNELHQRYPSDMDFVTWRARLALEQSDWKVLAELGSKYDVVKWSAVAEHASVRSTLKRNEIKSAHAWSDLIKQDICWRMIFNPASKTTVAAATCDNESLQKFLAILQSSGAEVEHSRDLFIRELSRERLDVQIASANYVNGLIWDSRLSVLNQIPDVELILKLPEFRAQSDLIRKRMGELKL